MRRWPPSALVALAFLARPTTSVLEAKDGLSREQRLAIETAKTIKATLKANGGKLDPNKVHDLGPIEAQMMKRDAQEARKLEGGKAEGGKVEGDELEEDQSIAGRVKRLEKQAFELLESDSRYQQMKTVPAMKAAEKELRERAEKDRAAAGELFEQALELDPYSANSLVQVGLRDKENADPALRDRAIDLLQRAFSPNVTQHVPIDSMQGWQLATWVFQHRWKQNHYPLARVFLQMATSSRFARENNDDCQDLQLATMVSAHPESAEDAAAVVAAYQDAVDELLARPKLDVSKTQNSDVYVFCVFSGFAHQLYQEADLKHLASLHHKLVAKAFPELRYDSPHLLRPMQRAGVADGARVRVGFVSAFFAPGSAVMDDFGGLLARLPRDTIEVVYVVLHEKPGLKPEMSQEWLLDVHGIGHADQVLHVKVGAGWLEAARRDLAALELDVLVYLELTLSTMGQRLAMARLAPVQCVTHGHPVTSGLPRSSMDHFISWAAAEPPDAARHYTEKLLLLPPDHPHLVHQRRADTAAGTSLVDGLSYRALARADFREVPEAWRAARWYVCMQKPYKLHPAFDRMLVDIQVRDADALLILHDIDHGARDPSVDTHLNRQLFAHRLLRSGLDVSRVVFMPAPSHHRLLALYSLADVVLDSYYAGGCTTSREATEVGGLVVTLPALYLGGRWTAAFYQVMGVTDLVAADPDDYVRIAVSMANDKAAAADVRQRLEANAHKLYESKAAVRVWTDLLLRIALKTFYPTGRVS